MKKKITYLTNIGLLKLLYIITVCVAVSCSPCYLSSVFCFDDFG